MFGFFLLSLCVFAVFCEELNNVQPTDGQAAENNVPEYVLGYPSLPQDTINAVGNQHDLQNVPKFDIASTNQKPSKCKTSDMLLKILNNLVNTLTDHLGVDEALTVAKVNNVLDLVKKYLEEPRVNFEDKELYNKFKDLQDQLEKSKENPEIIPVARNQIDRQNAAPFKTKVVYKYELPRVNQPSCRDAYMKLIEIAENAHNQLANSPVCARTGATQLPMNYQNGFEVVQNVPNYVYNSAVDPNVFYNRYIPAQQDYRVNPNALNSDSRQYYPNRNPDNLLQNNIPQRFVPGPNNVNHDDAQYLINDERQATPVNNAQAELYANLEQLYTAGEGLKKNNNSYGIPINPINNSNSNAYGVGNNVLEQSIGNNLSPIVRPNMMPNNMLNPSNNFINNALLMQQPVENKVADGKYLNGVNNLDLQPVYNDMQQVLNNVGKEPNQINNGLPSQPVNESTINHEVLSINEPVQQTQNGIPIFNKIPNSNDIYNVINGYSGPINPLNNTLLHHYNNMILNENVNPLQQGILPNPNVGYGNIDQNVNPNSGILNPNGQSQVMYKTRVIKTLNPGDQNNLLNNSPNNGAIDQTQKLQSNVVIPNNGMNVIPQNVGFQSPNGQNLYYQQSGGLNNGQNEFNNAVPLPNRPNALIYGEPQQTQPGVINDGHNLLVFNANNPQNNGLQNGQNGPNLQELAEPHFNNIQNILQNGQLGPNQNKGLQNLQKNLVAANNPQNIGYQNGQNVPSQQELLNIQKLLTQVAPNTNQNIGLTNVNPPNIQQQNFGIPQAYNKYQQENMGLLNPNVNPNINYGKHVNYMLGGKVPNLPSGSVSNLYKLNILPDNTGVIELTYLLRRPDPVMLQPFYVVKYRLPYLTFITHLKELLMKKPYLRSKPDKLYEELIPKSNFTGISTFLKGYNKDDIQKLVLQGGTFVKAKVLNSNAKPLNDELKTIQDLNSNLKFEEVLKIVDNVAQLNSSIKNDNSNVNEDAKDLEQTAAAVTNSIDTNVSSKNKLNGFGKVQTLTPNPLLSTVGYNNYYPWHANALASNPTYYSPRNLLVTRSLYPKSMVYPVGRIMPRTAPVLVLSPFPMNTAKFAG